MSTPHEEPISPTRGGQATAWLIAGSGALVLLVILALFLHARARQNKVSLEMAPKGVTVVKARASSYRPTRIYVGTLEPWLEAKLGPQLISAYVDTVLVRPGAVVKKGQVLATLDCRDASATSKAVESQAQAIQATQKAMADEAARLSQLLQGGFASPDEVETKKADSESKQAELLAAQAQLSRTALQVNDCVLKAPFDGEVMTRDADPGKFLRPGQSVATLVQRDTIRVTADVPEDDFGAVPPGTPVRIRVLATGTDLTATISRRAPAADAGTRTVHFEIDLPNADRSLPAGTTAELGVDVGEPRPATEVPLLAASVRGSRASLFVIAQGKARKVEAEVLGEKGASLFLEPALGAGSEVVTEGRATLADGDAVTAKVNDAWTGQVASEAHP